MKRFIPNILTMIRIFLVPIFVLSINSDLENPYFFALLIFLLASITDYFDGKLARKLKVVSKFGIFMDPLADKILVMTSFIIFLKIDLLSNIIFPWMVGLILFRDLSVTLLRLFMKRANIAMVTSKVAKLKTGMQLLSIILLLLLLSINNSFPIQIFSHYLKYLMTMLTLFTVYTGVDYYYRNLIIIISRLK
tara:strand:+ start:1098 stop:1673 length:576 start_codon:yes stop_codon:yes gene_type:complete